MWLRLMLVFVLSNTSSQMGGSGISTPPPVALVGGHGTSGFLFSLALLVSAGMEARASSALAERDCG